MSEYRHTDIIEFLMNNCGITYEEAVDSAAKFLLWLMLFVVENFSEEEEN